MASAGTNLIYRWQKGTDLGGSLAWAVVSLARVDRILPVLAGVLARCRQQGVVARDHGPGSPVDHEWLLGHRSARLSNGWQANSAMAEKDVADHNAKAQASWDAAKAELDRFADTKSAIDLQAPIDNTRAQLASEHCYRPSSLLARHRVQYGGVL